MSGSSDSGNLRLEAGRAALNRGAWESAREAFEGVLAKSETADRLHLSGHTVHRHISNIRTKLGLPSRSAAVAWAAQNGFL